MRQFTSQIYENLQDKLDDWSYDTFIDTGLWKKVVPPIARFKWLLEEAIEHDNN